MKNCVKNDFLLTSSKDGTRRKTLVPSEGTQPKWQCLENPLEVPALPSIFCLLLPRVFLRYFALWPFLQENHLQLLTQFHTACHPSKQLNVSIRLEAPHTRARQTICKVEQYLAKSSNILDLLIIVCSQPALAAKRMRISSPACRFSDLWLLTVRVDTN